MTHAIPVLYYHSIGEHPHRRPKSFLSIPRRVFEAQIERLQRWGLETVFLQDVHDYVQGRRTPAGREVALTFDDGFLDNWTIVWPLARKLGFKYTIFVNPEFVDPRDVVRPTIEEVWRGELPIKELPWWGYLSWPEMRRMEDSGLVDIQSHALTHTWYPVDGEVIDFHHPGDDYYWLAWNALPESKPFWLTEYDETAVPFGTPVYRFRKALLGPRYFPDPALDGHLVDCVQREGGARFFEGAGWRDTLHEQVVQFRKTHGDRGEYEDDEAYRARLRTELVASKTTVEASLDKTVHFLCWPGGSETPLGREIALAEGYWATTQGTEPNAPSADPTHIHRVSSWFGVRAPEPAKWLLFKGQVDRAQKKRSLAGMAASMLSRRRKLLANAGVVR